MAIVLVATLAWWLAMFWTGQPAIDSPFVFAFLPLVFFSVWLVLGWQLLALVRRHPQPHRRRTIAVVLLAFFLGPYSMMRAGCDMFTLSVRYHLWRAGGAEKVRAAFNQWVANRPPESPGSDEKRLFAQLKPGGILVPVPPAQLPPEVRYMNKHFPSRFGLGTAWKEVADLDNVYALTITHIQIGPPGWQPECGETLWNRITGNRRKVADGIWVEFGLYDK